MAQTNDSPQYSQGLFAWVQSQLDILIGADDFAPLLLSLDNTELQNYCNDLFGSNPTTQSFVNELISRRQQESINPPNKQKKHTRRGGKNKKHQNDPNKSMSLDPNQYQQTSKKTTSKHSKHSNKPVTSPYRQAGSMTITHAPISKKSSRSNRKHKKKRSVCGCQATLHDVFKNCTQCGNILCILEGEGACFHCSAFVTLAGSIPDKHSESYQKAVHQKEKLLRFGREKIAQTTIIDDQGDFYETEANNLWLTDKEREIAKQKAIQHENILNESRADRDIEICINFGDGNDAVIKEIEDTRKRYVFDCIDRDKELKDKMKEEDANTKSSSWYHNSSLTGHASKVYASLHKMIESEKNKKNEIKKVNDVENGEEAVDKIKQQFMEEANSDLEHDEDEKKAVEFLARKQQSKNVRKKLKKRSKYSDKSDCGVCLSMHQPWASLLVLGIKKVEGRSWSTLYRGRLWIASARREPTPFEIQEVEEQYMEVYRLKREQIPFPKEYPTTALLGCIDMVDCLSNEQYQQEYIKTGVSNENNASAFCFMCENPRRLMLPGAISGEHKLWKMPQERIKSMQSGLIPCELSWIKKAHLHGDDDDDENIHYLD